MKLSLDRCDPMPYAYDAAGKSRMHGCRSWRDRHVTALKFLAGNEVEMPSGGGRGIITVGGGVYWPGIVVSIKMLRETGCSLPVEVWHRGDAEPVNPEQVAGLDVRIVDSTQYAHRVLGGWEAKYLALTRTTLDTVLFLDADAYCVADPTMLLGKVAEFYGLGFWSDLPHQINTVKWPWVWPTGDGIRNPKAIQGGQLIIHRSKIWRELVLANWMCQHRDYFYPESLPNSDWYLYGDQDALRVAFAVTGASPVCLGEAKWDDVAFVCHAGQRPVIVHRCQGKLFRYEDIPAGKRAHKYNKSVPSLPKEARVFELLGQMLPKNAAVFEQHYRKRLWVTGSGTGSSNTESRPFLNWFHKATRQRGWDSVVDVGCGDGRVASQIKCGWYRGYDVSAEALKLFRAAAPTLSCKQLDCYTDREQLPAADVLLVRDVLQHWPNDWVNDWLKWVLDCNRWKAVVICGDCQQWQDGQNCPLGGWRPLDPNMHPLARFGLTEEMRYLHKIVLVKSLAL